MSSKFSSPFLNKSPLYGAYTSGADAMVTVSTAPHFAKLQSDISGAVDKFYAGKNDPCQKLEERYSSGAIGQERYEQGLKNCASKEKEKNKKNLISTEKGTGSAGSGKTTGSASMFPGFG